MKNKKWLRLTAFVPLVLFVVFINAYIDPANIIHDQSENVAKIMLGGNAAYVASGNIDERAVKLRFIQGLPKHIECICIGPSLSKGIRKPNVGTDSYYNLSMAGLNFYDYLAVFGMLRLNGIQFDRVIFCVDSYFFDENRFAKGTEAFYMMKYASYMSDFLDGKKPEEPKENYTMNYLINTIKSITRDLIYAKVRLLTSVTYFQASIEFIEKRGSFTPPEKRSGIVDKTTENLCHYMADGSWVYSLEDRNSTLKDVKKDCMEYDSKSNFSKGTHLDTRSKETFYKLLDYLVKNGVTVEFFLCPLAPSLWGRINNEPDAEKYYILHDLEPFALKVAADYGIKVTGSHNPYKVGVSDADFLDARHMRHEKLAKYFDFTK